jgi:conjugative relaxase-like TrwC/TraI family protein
MIRVTQQESAKAAKSYYTTADYYSEGKEIVGSWGGKGAARLGLSGTVDKGSFERLCDNLHPQTGKQLTAKTLTERTVGYDFTFSCPKSLSLLYALSEDQGIMSAFRGAVDDTMLDIETEMKTRVRKGGKDENRDTANAAWAQFVHTTSRPVNGIPDPQLHAHCFMFNATFDEQESQWKAGQFRELKRDAPYFQAMFRVRLAGRLQDLGFGVERKRDDFEIAGIKPDMLKRFSRRTALIEKLAKEKGITNPKVLDGLGAETREKKDKTLSWKQLRQEWRSWLSDSEWEQLRSVYRRERKYARPERGERMAVDHAIGHSFVREAVVPERKLLTEALKRGIGSVTVEGVKQEMGKRPLIRSEVAGRKMATTQEMLALEEKIIDFARRGRGKCLPLGDRERPCSREWFNEEQKAVVRHVLGSRDKVTIVRGAAGTGKTTLEQELGEGLAEAGKKVVAIAQSVKASREVLRQEAGFAEADTVSMFLKDQKMQEGARGGVILVDEASMIGNKDMLDIFRKAEELNARVVLVGDRWQHRSVSAGEPLRLLEEKAGLKVAEVTQILRQKGDYKKAAEALSKGRIEEGFGELNKLGWIKEVPDSERNRQLADAYLAAASEKKKDGKLKALLVVSPTHAEGNKITQAIRDGLKAKGKLRKEKIMQTWMPAHLTEAEKADPTQYEPGDMIQFQQNAVGHSKGSRLIVEEKNKPPVELAKRFEVYRPVQLGVAVGDRVRVTAGGKTKEGNRLNNGSLLTVQGFTKRGDIVVDHGWVIDKDFGHLTYGYCLTSHASQGVTVDKVFIGLSNESLPATDERTGYVAVTRGREQVQIFTDDKHELLRAMARADQTLSATELAEAAYEEPAGRQAQTVRRPFGRGPAQAGMTKHNSTQERGDMDHER